MKLKRVFSILFISTLTTMLFVGCNNLNQKAQKEAAEQNNHASS